MLMDVQFIYDAFSRGKLEGGWVGWRGDTHPRGWPVKGNSTTLHVLVSPPDDDDANDEGGYHHEGQVDPALGVDWR